MERTDEREAKYDVEQGATLPDLNGVVKGASTAERPEVRLAATYFDTPDLRLLQRDVTLRHRRDLSGAGEDLWTLKVPADTGHASFERREVSWPGSESSVPVEAAFLVAGITGGHALGVVAGITTRRRPIDISDDAGNRLAEVDDDLVSVTTPIAIDFRQVEVELDTGDDRLLDAIASRLGTAGATRSPDEPKLRTALSGRSSKHAPPVVPTVHPGSTIGEVVTACIAGGLERLVSHDIGVRLDSDPEFVHQARVATRRLRSDLRTFGDALDAGWLTRTRADLEWLGTALGAVRDADMLAVRLDEHASHAAAIDHEAFCALAGRLRAQRTAAWRRLGDIFGSRRYLELLQRLEVAARTPPFDLPTTARPPAKQPAEQTERHHGADPNEAARDALATLVGQPWRKLRRAIENLGDTPSDADLHRVRINAKKLRYAAEAAVPVVGEPARRLAKAAEAAQGVLGDHRDAVTAEMWLREVTEAGSATEAFAAGQCVAREQERQEQRRAEWPNARDHLSAKDLRRWLR